MSKDESEKVRAKVAQNDNTPEAVLKKLAKDAEPYVAGLALSKLFGGKQQKGGMSTKQLTQQKKTEAQTEGLAEETQDANRENIMNALMYSTSPDQMNQTNQIPLKKEGMFKQGGKVKYHV